MRIFMTLVTLGAAGAGYVYLNRTPGEPYLARSNGPSLFDWNHHVASSAHTSATDVVQQIREHTRSVLDDMTWQHAGHSDAPVDDAFQRLQQITETTILAANTGETSPRETGGSSKSSIVPLPTFDDVQRTAFDPSSDKDSGIQSAQVRDDSISNSEAAAPKPKTNALEPTSTSDRPASAQAGNSRLPATTSPISNASRSAAKSDPKRTVRNTDASKTAYEWKVVGKTTQGLPMHSAHLGDGGTRTLVIAGLYGDDRTGVRWLEMLVDEVARHPEFLKTNEIVFFRAGNPDGLMHLRKENSRGVLINRNFPSRRYRPAADMPKFAVPASESETRVILDALYTFRPRRVIHLVATTGRSQVLYNKLAKSAAIELESSAKINVSPLDAELYPGSIEDFAEGTLEAAVLSMRLSVESDWNQAWSRLQPSVLTAVVGRSFDAGWSDGEQIFDPDRTPLKPPSIEPLPQLPRRRGYEELPPPPE